MTGDIYIFFDVIFYECIHINISTIIILDIISFIGLLLIDILTINIINDFIKDS